MNSATSKSFISSKPLITGLPVSDNLRKREEFAISLRKQKKAEILALKRKKNLLSMSKAKLANQSESVPEFCRTPEQVTQVLSMIENNNDAENLLGLITAIRILSV